MSSNWAGMQAAATKSNDAVGTSPQDIIVIVIMVIV